MGKEEKKKSDPKTTINDGDSETMPFCLYANKLTVKKIIGKPMRTVKLKINESSQII